MIRKKTHKSCISERKSPRSILNLFRAQSTIEYAILIAIVATALIAMQVYVRRAVEANLKMMQERINAAPQ